MSARTAATRYAKALFDVALLEQADLVRIDRDLRALADVWTAHGAALQAITRHGVPEAARRGAAEAIARALGVSPQVGRLAVMLAVSRKLTLLPETAAAFRRRLQDHQQVVSARVASAAPLDPAAADALARGLSEVTGKTVDLSLAVDPDLLGGIVATIGSTVYDGSVRTQLKKLKAALTA